MPYQLRIKGTDTLIAEIDDAQLARLQSKLEEESDEGRDYYNEGPEILKKAASRNRALDTALATWGDITFNYESTDTPDVVATPTRV